MNKSELKIQLIKIAIGLAFGNTDFSAPKSSWSKME